MIYSCTCPECEGQNKGEFLIGNVMNNLVRWTKSKDINDLKRARQELDDIIEFLESDDNDTNT